MRPPSTRRTTRSRKPLSTSAWLGLGLGLGLGPLSTSAWLGLGLGLGLGSGPLSTSERLVALGQPKLPRAARVLDARERRGTGAAVVAGDLDGVRVRVRVRARARLRVKG